MDFPKPNKDTGIGLHDDANCGWKPNDFGAEIAKLKEHGVSWYLFFVCDEGKADWARCLVDNDIMPILRIWPMYFPKMQFDIAHLLAYRDAGVKWFEVGNEPNLEGEWEGSLPNGRDAARKVAEKYAGIANTVRDAEMWPLTPALSPGGNINHRFFFQRFIERIMELGGESVLWEGGIGLHCRPLGNPLADGPDNYDCSAREWEWFDRVIKEHLGRSLPMCNTEMGDQPDWLPRGAGGNYDWGLWAARNIELWHWYDPQSTGYRYPSHMMADCFWIYRDAGTWDHCGLVDNLCYERETGQGRETNLWKAMPGAINWTRGDITPPPAPYRLIERLRQAPHGFTDQRAEIESFSDMDRLLATQRVFGDLGVNVIHHSGNDKPHTPLDIAHWAIEQCTTIDHPTIPYHFCIMPDGHLYFTAKLIWQTYHCYGRNKGAVGISFVGSFVDEPPTHEAIEACRFLIMALWEFFGQKWGKFRPMALMPHKWVVGNVTACPGKAWRQLIWGDDQHPAEWPNLRSKE